MLQFAVEQLHTHTHTDMFDLVSNHKAAFNFLDNWEKLSSCLWVNTGYVKCHTVTCIRDTLLGLTINVLNLRLLSNKNFDFKVFNLNVFI